MYSCECDYNKCCEYDKYITNKYKSIKRFVIGKTTLGREIMGYNIGAENGLIVCGAVHGMERITSSMIYKFIDDVCTHMQKNNHLANQINKSGITLVPMLNPDGVEISIHGAKTAGKCTALVENILKQNHISHTKWQSNANGVDLNHNFDADYLNVKKHENKLGINAPSHTRYGGKRPESECETKALCNLCRKYNYHMCVALHTQGQEIYYDFGEHTPKNSLCVAKRLSRLSGYKVSHPQKVAVGGGFKDWFIEHFHRLGFTIEIGKGTNPLSPDVITTEYPAVSKMLWYLLLNK